MWGGPPKKITQENTIRQQGAQGGGRSQFGNWKREEYLGNYGKSLKLGRYTANVRGDVLLA